MVESYFLCKRDSLEHRSMYRSHVVQPEIVQSFPERQHYVKKKDSLLTCIIQTAIFSIAGAIGIAAICTYAGIDLLSFKSNKYLSPVVIETSRGKRTYEFCSKDANEVVSKLKRNYQLQNNDALNLFISLADSDDNARLDREELKKLNGLISKYP